MQMVFSKLLSILIKCNDAFEDISCKWFFQNFLSILIKCNDAFEDISCKWFFQNFLSIVIKCRSSRYEKETYIFMKRIIIA